MVYALNGAAWGLIRTTAGSRSQSPGQPPSRGTGGSGTRPSSRSRPSRRSCQTAARKGHDQVRRASLSSHSSTSTKIEWPRLAFWVGGSQGRAFPIACIGVVRGEREPLHSQPVSFTGGRDPSVSGGGSSTRRSSTSRAGSTAPDRPSSNCAHADSRAR